MNQEVNVTIRMNDDDIAKVVSRGLAALSDEDCASIVHDALKLVLSSNEGKQLFIKTDGYYGSKTQPTKFTEDLLKRCMESDAGFNSELKKCGEDFVHTSRDKQAFNACNNNMYTIETKIKTQSFEEKCDLFSANILSAHECQPKDLYLKSAEGNQIVGTCYISSIDPEYVVLYGTVADLDVLEYCRRYRFSICPEFAIDVSHNSINIFRYHLALNSKYDSTTAYLGNG